MVCKGMVNMKRIAVARLYNLPGIFSSFKKLWSGSCVYTKGMAQWFIARLIVFLFC